MSRQVISFVGNYLAEQVFSDVQSIAILDNFHQAMLVCCNWKNCDLSTLSLLVNNLKISTSNSPNFECGESMAAQPILIVELTTEI